MNEFLLQYIPLPVYVFLFGIMMTLAFLLVTDVTSSYLCVSPESRKICMVLQMQALCIWSYLYVVHNDRLSTHWYAGYFYSTLILTVLTTSMIYWYFDNTMASQKKE